MPPQPKRNRAVVLYDMSCKNQHTLRQMLIKIYAHHYFRSSKDLVNLVLVNSESTENRKNKPHITVVNHEATTYDPTFIYDKIETKNCTVGGSCANWKDALDVALQILIDDHTSRIITYKILFLTDMSCFSESERDIGYMVNQLKANNIFLFIIGPNVILSKTLCNFDDLKSCMEDVIFEDSNDNLVESIKMVQKCDNAVIADCIIGLELFLNYSNPIGKKPWTAPLTIGSKIQYAVGTPKLMEKQSGFDLQKKHSNRAPTVFVSAEDVTKEYGQEDVRKGLCMHGQFIPLESNDIFKESLERTFSVLFFTNIKSIPEYMMIGPGCYSVFPSEMPSAFYSLLHVLDEEKKCMIVKRVYAQKFKPIYMAVIPLVSKKCFRAIQLPYESDVPFNCLETEPQKLDVDITPAIEDFFQSITVNNENFSLNCLLTPNLTKSSKGEVFVNLATEKLLKDPNLKLGQVDFDPFLTGINTEIGSELREMWPSRAPVEISKDDPDDDDEDDNESDKDYF